MNITRHFLFLIATMIPLAAVGEEIVRQKTATPEMQKDTLQRTQAIVPGSYVGPNGQRIKIKRTIKKGGDVSELAAKGIIIVNSKPADGRYVGPGGVSFLVRDGIIAAGNQVPLFR